MLTRIHRAHRVAAVTTLALAGLGAACVPPSAPDISHTSRWTSATFATIDRNTTIEIAAGLDDAAGDSPRQTLEVHVTQAWCEGVTWITRDLSGSSSAFLGAVNTVDGNASVVGAVTASGTETRTPAGAGCATPEGAGSESTVSQKVTVAAQVSGVGEQSMYSREDGGQYIYQDADASGVVALDSKVLHFSHAEAAGTWLWQGYWADATGLDPATLLP